jgi:hypothetical protein
MKSLKNIANKCFAACTESVRLLDFFTDVARRATTDGLFPEFQLSTGGHFRDGFIPLTAENNLTRREIFRGKVSRRKNQN